MGTSIEALESRIAPAAYVVTTLADIVAADGFVSLREAILAANTKLAVNEAAAGDADGNSITFDSSLHGSIGISSPFTISDDLSIDGMLPGGDILDMDGALGTRFFLINTSSGAGTNHDVALNHLTLKNGISGASQNGGAISLTASQLTLNDVEIDGSGASNRGGAIYAQDATLLINNSDFTANFAGGGVGAVLGGAIAANHSTVTITDSTFSGNNGSVNGGAIGVENGSTLTLTRVDFVGNSIDFDGGAISANQSIVTITDTTFSSNNTSGNGGAIHAQDATLFITNSDFSNNFTTNVAGNTVGGAIHANHSIITIKDSAFFGNNGSQNGGAIGAENGSTLTLTRVDFEANTTNDTGGAIFVSGSSLLYTTGTISNNHADGFGGGGIASAESNVTLNFVDFESNEGIGFGGAIKYDASAAKTLTIHGGRYANNTSAGGGAIAVSGLASIDLAEFDSNGTIGGGGALLVSTGSLTIANSSLHHNHAGAGGAIFSNGALVMVQCTLSNNTGNPAGANLDLESGTATLDNSTIIGDAGTNVTVRNAIVQIASSILAGSSNDLNRTGSGSISLDHSLVETLSAPVTSTASLMGVDPLLGSFGDHGGPLPTWSLLPGSPAIDAGSDPHSLPSDQRGAPFARTEGAGIDMGAFEAPPSPVVTLLAHGKKAQFRDVDGDLVTISTSRGAFTESDIFLIAEGLGARLAQLDISFLSEFAGANISIKAVRSGRGGDGFVNVSYFNATGVDLGNVLIDGDVTNFRAGDSDASTAGVNGLSVLSVGEFEGIGDIRVTGAMNSLKVRTDVTDTEITISGGPAANLSKVKITGSVLSTDISVDGGMSAFSVFGNFIDSSLIAEGSIGAVSNATLPGKFRYSGGVVVKGSVLGGDIGTNGDLANFRVSGDVQATLVSARGDLVTPDLLAAQTMGALTIGGRASHSDFLLGYDLDLHSVNPDVQLDKVTVTGGWVGSNLAVGAEQGADGLLGTADDEAISGGNGAITSRIASIVIKGAAYGTPGESGDFYGIAAEEIVKGKVALTTLPLSAGAGNDLGPTLLGVSFDFAVHEVGSLT